MRGKWRRANTENLPYVRKAFRKFARRDLAHLPMRKSFCNYGPKMDGRVTSAAGVCAKPHEMSCAIVASKPHRMVIELATIDRKPLCRWR